MRKKFKTYLNTKNHSFHDINRELLYKNRLTKSIYFIMLLITACTVNVFIVYYALNKTISLLIVDRIFDLFIYTSLVIGLVVVPYHPRNYGFNLNKLKENLIIGFGLGLVFVGIGISFRLYLSGDGAINFNFNGNMSRFFIDLLYYPLCSFSQEALFRGVFQSYFIAILGKSKRYRLISIIIPSIIFGQFHILYGGIPVFFGAFALSIMLGFIYERSRSLVAVTIIHFFAGAGLFFFSSAIQ